MKIFAMITLLLLVGILKNASAQDTIYWSPQYKLKWTDFQGKPNSTSKYRAISNSGIRYRLSSNEDSFKIRVACYFIKSKSWTTNTNSSVLLLHEQGHFDIAELFARKLRKSYAEYKFHYSTIKTDFNHLFELNDQERVKMDIQYDKETNLSENTTNQLLWNKKIKVELGKLKKYTSPIN